MTLLLFMTVFAGFCGAVSIEQSKAGLQGRDFCEGNTPDNRQQWCDYDIYTDYTEFAPDTGVTREYWLEVIDVVVSPDGFERPGQAVNGTIPGPTITADWGDTIVVHVANNLKDSNNGTSIHFHGIRQNYTNPQDGVTSITECPAPPGSSVTYRFRAVQYGTSWYHSHFALQTYDGVFGPVIVNGPASANYDEDKGLIIINDWSHQTVHELLPGEEIHGPPDMDNALLNGTGVYGNDGERNQTGKRYELSLEENKTYRLRFLNGAMDSHFKLSIDHHILTVISVDFVAIQPYQTESLSLGIGQRVDVLITTDQADKAHAFWLRATPQTRCSKIANPANVRGVIHYGADTSVPETTGPADTAPESCVDEPGASIVPMVSKHVDEVTTSIFENATLERANKDHVAKWFLNSTSMVVEWNQPSLLKLIDDLPFQDSNAVIRLPEANTWTYVAIETAFNISHPIHLHGFDFHILAQGTGPYTPDIPLQTTNSPRRDTAVLPANGFLVIAFLTDNPGVWLMHCHIGWHASEGFSLQFIVREDEIPGLFSDENRRNLREQCKRWDAHTGNVELIQEDSGI